MTKSALRARYAHVHAKAATDADTSTHRGDLVLQRELVLLVRALTDGSLDTLAMAAVVTELYDLVNSSCLSDPIALISSAQFSISARRILTGSSPS